MVHGAPAVVYRAPVRALLTWSDAGTVGPAPAHLLPRPASDRGPVLRLLDHTEPSYDAIWILTIPSGEKPAEGLMRSAEAKGGSVEVRVLSIDDPSDYKKLYRALAPVVAAAKRAFPRERWAIDVLLSAGTPQAQAIWVILVKAGILAARMLQVIPAVFVGRVHPEPVREVRLDIEGFPEIRALRDEVQRLRAQEHARLQPFLGDSDSMQELRARLARVSATDVPVLVLGETGSGKELVARAIHMGSGRSEGPFIAENCGVFTEGVIESELFGHEAGAFTGAVGRRRGMFEQATGGTLLLDEVGELSPRVQAALLRVLQEGTLRRVGGEKAVSVDVRIIAATHRNLARMVAEGTFREDLYYRLRGATLEVPPLRARGSDVELLIEAFLDEVRARKGSAPVVTREALRVLSSYAWPGNVRELRAEVLRWSIFCDEMVDVSDLAPEIRTGRSAPSGSTPKPTAGTVTLAAAVEAAERVAIASALDESRGNLSLSARTLGIDRNTLKRKMARYGLRGEG